MHSFLSHILPTLESLGVWSYWIVGLFSFLEGWWVTGVIAPGTLVVDAGGALVRLGYLDFFDLVWFVAIGAILGGEVSWHTGRWLGGRLRLPQGKTFERAQDLVRRRGPVAVVMGRFLGPVAGLAALAAALSGLSRRQFVVWNIVGGILYALAHVSMGYIAGDILARITPYLPRIVLPLGLFAVIVAITWLLVRHIRRGWPLIVVTLEGLARHLSEWPPMKRLSARHPRITAVLAKRLHLTHGGGLLTTAIVVLLIYLVGVFVDNAFDLTFLPETAALDARIANLAHAYWSDTGLTIAGWLTQLGHVPVATTVAAGAVAFFALWGRPAAAIGLAVSVAGDAVTVTVLKLAFGRARPELGYFLETSHSFPSGHAAISVALYACLFVMLWRERFIGPTVALVGGMTVAAAIGLTRIYLVEHYLSDVLNGWIIGGIWLVVGFGVAERLRRTSLPARAARPALALGVAALSLGVAGWLAVEKRPVLKHAQTAPQTIVADLEQAATDGTLPLDVVTLTGEALPPVTLIVQGATPEALAAHLSAGGWTPVPAPGVTSVVAALRGEFADQARADATALPAFRDALPAALTLRAPSGHSILRLWPAGQSETGAEIVAVALSPEGDLAEWSEAEVRRDVLSLLPGTVQRVPTKPLKGKTDLHGTPWSTDGQLALLKLPQSPPATKKP
ncbi:bifunctional DedA family/phosphatase PAP2 family protein [Pseudooceanicola nanhaiensis]|uniref:bifunctional DedA family/phosphatase PAP2 family protein n=1 Tax=Pseudooceanicola nanhaiensis TaxID=375761 RepID=UPI001CD6D5B1|nr:bifunctional DedA family/phosphatase PAP2 family protein [Pseudooceanicola nanhaiensis]MCA0922850.1 bifunctional DedA family/phosphatase PAP2 family protein [Pseudooceanicola nanhaiensis]